MTAAERERLRRLVDQRRRLLTGRTADGIQHGSPYAYKRGCRCRECRDASAAYRRLYRQRAAAAWTKEAR